MYDKRELWKEIERLQEELHNTITQKGVNSPEAVRARHDFRNKMQEYNDLINR